MGFFKDVANEMAKDLAEAATPLPFRERRPDEHPTAYTLARFDASTPNERIHIGLGVIGGLIVALILFCVFGFIFHS